ncbi:ABC-type antimicrobial peptide transport system, permease component [[Actinomadura] parvosata subsp. kistnae]|uniref:Uncharacterized protein n=1 Tax=[Actinomadura] parvosata subsp. kistnae TaxID=1909395 RepID=A0A1U9ZYU0_9ACTN|nr:ABC transporter permease [Nonomuraea sp. ATCC 55076]AQZ63114.1 hypothetical protein BKM31_18050 [Nonomuraea sp. ATCC 55076]SPL98746.1 ABC-type antimicrobial peptide transport system, permease component [Actinomadura parvosata subsp. kistnae]
MTSVITPVTVPLARRSLFADRRRAILAVSGVAVALALVLLFDAVLAGASDRVTFYLRTSPADVFISQKDVTTMHMSSSSLDPTIVSTAARVDGVYWLAPLAYLTATLTAADHQQLSYVFGYDTISGGGGPPGGVDGAPPRPGHVVIDRVAAEQLKVGLGDQVMLVGRPFTISGLSEDGTSITNTTSYIDIRDFATLGRAPLSYLLVGARPGTVPEDLAHRLALALPQATVQTRDEFVGQELALINDMAADVMRLMNVIAFILALAVIALVLSAVTRANLRSYAVIGAIGARPARLVRVLAAQAVWTALPAVAAATALTLLIAAVLPRFAETLPLAVRPGAVLQTTAAALLAAAVGALVPLRAIIRVDAATAFRRTT